MALCKNCGQRLGAKAKFCPSCGASVLEEGSGKRVQEYEGTIHKCPNCGEIVNSFTTTCTACGFEFRSVNETSAVTELSKKIEEIEMNRKPSSAIMTMFGLPGKASATDDKLENVIRSFSIPNTKEDLYEFMILASSNIDASLYNAYNGMMPQERMAKLKITKAWVAKFDQAYEKARLALDEEDLERFKKIYAMKQKEIKSAKRKTRFIIEGCVGFLLAVFIIPLAILGIKEEECERRLNRTLQEIQVDIQLGNYDAALLKANTLYFDKELSNEKAESWDKQREAIIRMLEEKKGENE